MLPGIKTAFKKNTTRRTLKFSHFKAIEAKPNLEQFSIVLSLLSLEFVGKKNYENSYVDVHFFGLATNSSPTKTYTLKMATYKKT